MASKLPSKDEILVFTGYTDPNIQEDDKILQPDQMVQVWEVDSTGAIAVLPQKEDGTFDAESGDTIYEGEYMTVADWEAAKSGVAPAATVEAGKAKGKGKAKAAAKTETKVEAPAATPVAAGKGKGKAKAKTEAEAPAGQSIQPATRNDVPQLIHSESVQSILNDTDALDAAKELVERAAENDYTLGGVLTHIRNNGIHQRLGFDGGKDGFSKYIENELGIAYRKAMYLISIYEHFRALDIPEERLAEIGWSKAKELVAITDRTAFDEAHEYAKAHTRDELIAHVKQTVNAGDGSGTGNAAGTATKVTRNFRLFNEQAETVDRALAAAKVQAGSDDDNQALEHICAEWQLMSENNSFTLEDYLTMVENKFNVQLEIVQADDQQTDSEFEQVEENDLVEA